MSHQDELTPQRAPTSDSRPAAAQQSSPGVVDVTETSGEPRPLSELISQAAQDATTLMRKEVELAKVEVRQEINQAKKAGLMFGIAGLLGYMTLVMLSFAAAWGLASVMSNGLAFAIVGVIYAVATAIAFLVARRAMKQVSPTPEVTIETVKEDVQWAKHPTN